MKIVTIGGAMQDIFIHHRQPEIMHMHTTLQKQSYIILAEGKKTAIEQLMYYTGGGAVNTAVSFAHLGMHTTIFCKVGTDQPAHTIINHLKKEHVEIKYIVRSTHETTGTSFIIPCPSGDRAILVYRGANTTITVKELPIKAIVSCDYVYITSLSGASASLLPTITKMAKKYKKIVATNPGTHQLTQGVDIFFKALRTIDILIVNCWEATLLMQSLVKTKSHIHTVKKKTQKNVPPLLQTTIQAPFCFVLEEFFHEIRKKGPHIVVVTNGADGVYATDGKKIYYHPSLNVKIVSTVGAGDAFGSTFVTYLAHKKSIENALRAGIINSASVLEYLDAQTGLLSAKELGKRVKNIDKLLLQRF